MIGDRKTPASCAHMVDMVRDEGLDVDYLDVGSQDEWGKSCPDFYRCIPYDNETRRIIGYLRALEEGCERIILIDDDNYPRENEDFIGGHSTTGTPWNGHVVTDPLGFLNTCEELEVSPAREIWPRGYPLQHRGGKNKPSSRPAPADAVIGVTAGLWLQDPDVDATTWLNGSIIAVRYHGPRKVVLAGDTWIPVNTQNTSIHRELIPAFLCIPMGFAVPGGKLERYGDIWGGYIGQAIARGTRYHVSFGAPLVDHRRNQHNYVDDLRHEFWGMVLTDWFVDMLKNEFVATSEMITERVRELATFIGSHCVRELPKWAPDEIKSFLKQISEVMYLYSKVCETLQ
ncbi:MAG: hypothetical protein ACYS14_00680 [Planctomycetota bacterium]